MKVPASMIPPGGAYVSDTNDPQPRSFTLAQNYPNPFNPTTNIEFSLTEPEHVLLVIYNVNGREVARLINETMPAGRHNLVWNAQNLTSGIYFCTVTAGSLSQTWKMLLLK